MRAVKLCPNKILSSLLRCLLTQVVLYNDCKMVVVVVVVVSSSSSSSSCSSLGCGCGVVWCKKKLTSCLWLVLCLLMTDSCQWWWWWWCCWRWLSAEVVCSPSPHHLCSEKMTSARHSKLLLLPMKSQPPHLLVCISLCSCSFVLTVRRPCR